MNAAKFTLTSTVLAAALGLALGLTAVPSDSYACHKDTAHGKQADCDNGGDGGIVYTAELTAGAFVFHPSVHDPEEESSAHVVVVTPNQREDVLRSEEDLNLGINNLDITDLLERQTWVAMFATCDELWVPGPVEAFFVGEDDWSIHEAGGVRVVFRHIEDQGAEFRFQLIGDEFDFLGDPFLPENPGDTSLFELTEFAITAKSLAGGSGGTKFCRTLGGEFGELILMPSPSILKITASAP